MAAGYGPDAIEAAVKAAIAATEAGDSSNAAAAAGEYAVDEAVEMTAYEDFVVERVKAGETIIGLYPRTKEEHSVAFEEWRKQQNRCTQL